VDLNGNEIQHFSLHITMKREGRKLINKILESPVTVLQVMFRI